MLTIQSQCELAKKISFQMPDYTTVQKNQALTNMATALLENQNYILAENQKDLDLGQKSGLSASLLDRLALNSKRLHDMSDSLITIKNLPDPINEVLSSSVRPNGLKISKIRVPFGVIGIIYEARPNVTVDAVGLALKSSNCVVLRGSSSSYQSNLALATVLKKAILKAGLNPDCVQLLEDTSRESVTSFLQMNQYLDLIIPRGSGSLIQTVVQNATVPTLETGEGNCHVYVDQSADLEMAEKILLNAKVSRPSVCNSAEKLIVHSAIAQKFLPKTIQSLKNQGVQVRGDEKTKKIIPDIISADESDWPKEYLDYIIAIKVVDSIEEAIAHINKYNTKHTEAIMATDPIAISKFKNQIDACAVMVNASTRFTDGGEFGFGAEMGISTQKLHARGPVGLPELTTYKYIVEGTGQIR